MPVYPEHYDMDHPVYAVVDSCKFIGP